MTDNTPGDGADRPVSRRGVLAGVGGADATTLAGRAGGNGGSPAVRAGGRFVDRPRESD